MAARVNVLFQREDEPFEEFCGRVLKSIGATGITAKEASGNLAEVLDTLRRNAINANGESK
jgi:hypothetical protein